MLVKAETLNFREVNVGLLRGNVVSGESNNGFILFIVEPEEYDSSLRRPNDNLLFNGLEFPIDSRFRLPFKLDFILFKIPHCDKLK